MSKGRFGVHGGQYIPETLMNAVLELEEAYNHYKNDPEFNRELAELLNEYAGRPSRLYYAAHMTEDLGGAKVYLKREDLNHTGAHKINNVLGQVLLAKKMGKTRVIAETGAGQHGVATATAAAMMGMECEVFMGKEDTERQALNVYRMRLGSESSCGYFRNCHVKRCSFRDHERVDKPGRRYALCAGFCDGTASFSDDCQRFSGGNFQRDQGADSGERGTASGCCAGVCRRRIECDRNLL